MKEMRDTMASAPETRPPDAGVSRAGPLMAYLAALHDLAIFEPWFLVLGFLLALAGRWFAGPAASRRWTLSLVAAIVLIDAFGAALALTHHRFAVS
jgi:hypothetical protein